jgi:phospholipase/lecithinase/hemolysin
MIMRRRPLLRAAVVGGGAYMAGKSAARRQQEQQYAESQQNQRIQDLEQQPAQVPSQASPSLFDQLNQLSSMHDKGSLTDEEFAAAKSRLLGGT